MYTSEAQTRRMNWRSSNWSPDFQLFYFLSKEKVNISRPYCFLGKCINIKRGEISQKSVIKVNLSLSQYKPYINPNFFHPFKYFIKISIHKTGNWRNNQKEVPLKLENFMSLLSYASKVIKRKSYLQLLYEQLPK